MTVPSTSSVALRLRGAGILEERKSNASKSVSRKAKVPMLSLPRVMKSNENEPSI